MSTSKSKSNPLTSPATPIALHSHHLLSPPPDLLTNTATTLTITPTQDKHPSPIFTIHRIRAHESLESPNRTVLLYTACGKQWPNASRVVCDAEGVPLLVLKRVWLSGVRKWTVRLPGQQHTADLLVASMPWAGDGVGVGKFRLDVRFMNVLAGRSGVVQGGGGGGVGAISDAASASVLGDEPPPYSAVSGVGVGVEAQDAGAGVGAVQRNENENEKDIHPSLPILHSHSHSHPAQIPIASSPSHTPIHIQHHPHSPSPSILPSYDSVRRNSPNSLRDLLDAIEPPQEPAPALLFPSSASASTSTSASQNANPNPNASTSTSLGPRLRLGHTGPEADSSGSKVDLRVTQLAGSGTGVMMGNQKIMHISRRNVMDYSRSKSRLRPRWEVEVAEGVDLLLAVNIVLIMAESVSSQNRWR